MLCLQCVMPSANTLTQVDCTNRLPTVVYMPYGHLVVQKILEGKNVQRCIDAFSISDFIFLAI